MLDKTVMVWLVVFSLLLALYFRSQSTPVSYMCKARAAQNVIKYIFQARFPRRKPPLLLLRIFSISKPLLLEHHPPLTQPDQTKSPPFPFSLSP
ncbi:hypothetical protein V8C37DRAFT_29135 [Trichoderma ceciliae]